MATNAELTQRVAELEEEVRALRAGQEGKPAQHTPDFMSQGTLNDIEQAKTDIRDDGRERTVRDPNTGTTYRIWRDSSGEPQVEENATAEADYVRPTGADD